MDIFNGAEPKPKCSGPLFFLRLVACIQQQIFARHLEPSLPAAALASSLRGFVVASCPSPQTSISYQSNNPLLLWSDASGMRTTTIHGQDDGPRELPMYECFVHSTSYTRSIGALGCVDLPVSFTFTLATRLTNCPWYVPHRWSVADLHNREQGPNRVNGTCQEPTCCRARQAPIPAPNFVNYFHRCSVAVSGSACCPCIPPPGVSLQPLSMMRNLTQPIRYDGKCTIRPLPWGSVGREMRYCGQSSRTAHDQRLSRKPDSDSEPADGIPWN